ncbi:MAG: NAD(P)H-hydrate dehydratase, partial [Acidobacteriota bacterium]
ADTTVTFVAPKIPHLLPPAETFCGDLVVAQIGIPEQAVEAEGVTLEWVDEDLLAGRLPPRPDDSHKGNYGHVLVVGGSLGKCGAVRLAVEAVLTGGAGLVTAAVPATLRPEVALSAAAMTLPLAETSQGGISRRAITPLKKALQGKAVLAVGMGAGQGKETQGLIRSLVRSAAVPVVLDADGLNAFAGHEKDLSGSGRPLILTPHPGEMARLVRSTGRDIQADRITVCRQFALDHACYVVLKGYRTLIGTPGGQVYVNSTGNPGMATAGAGDALTGFLAGLLAADLPVEDALILGVFAHGLAGDLSAETRGVTAVTVASLLEALPEAMRQLEDLAS